MNIKINVKVVNKTSDMSNKRVTEVMNNAKSQIEGNLFKGIDADGNTVTTTLNFTPVSADKIDESKDFFIEFTDNPDAGFDAAAGQTKEIGNTEVNKFQILSETILKDFGMNDVNFEGKTVAHELGHGGGLRHADDPENPTDVKGSMNYQNFMRAEAVSPYTSSPQQLSQMENTIVSQVGQTITNDNKKKKI